MPSDMKLNKVSWHLIIVFILLSIGIGISGYFYYENQKEHIKKRMEEELSTIADLKVNQISTWRKERIKNVTLVSRSSFVTLGIKNYLKNPSDPIQRKRVLNFMTSFKETYDFQRVFLLDQRQRGLLSAPEGKHLDCPHFKKIVDEAFRKHQIVLTDLHRVENDGRIHIGIVAPIKDPEGVESTPIALFMIEVNPHQFLYPLIQSWPIHSQTSETLLFRREGEEVVYLNELRHRKNTALNLRLSIHEERLPAAMAIRGKEGIVEGLDYRGVPVIAAIRRILDSPWFLIPKVDKEEVSAPIYEQAKTIAILVTLLTIGSGIILGLFWSQQRGKFYRKQYETELKHLALLQRFAYLNKYANDIILLIDQDLKIVESNDRALSSYGYTRDEILQLNLRELRPPELRVNLETQIKQVEQSNGLVYETVHQRKDGTVFPVEVSSRVIDVEGIKFYQSIIRDITERKRAEEALRSEKTWSEVIVSSAPNIIVGLGEGSNILIFNKFAEKLTGYKAEEVIGKSWIEIFIPEKMRGELYSIWDDIVKNKLIEHHFENLIVTKQGEEKTISWSNTVLTSDDQFKMVLSIGEDITERKRSEEALRASEEKYRIIADNTADVIVVMDMNLRTIYISPSILRIRGYTVEEAMGQTLEQVMTPESLQSALKVFEEEMKLEASDIADPGRIRIMELEEYKKDGSTIWGEVSLSFLRDKDQKPIGIVSITRDITERKRSEESMINEKQKFQSLSESAPFGMVMIDKEGIFKYVNPKFKELFGYDLADVPDGKSWFRKAYPNPDNRHQVISTWIEDWKNRPEGEGIPRVFKVTCKNGTEKIINFITVRLKTEEFLLNLEDLTPLMQAEEKRRSLEEQLRQSQKMEAIGRLAGGIAHDFNNLLTIISGNAQLSLPDLLEEDPLRANIEEIKRASERAADLTKQLLAFSRKQILEMKVLDLNQVLQRLDKMLRRVIGEDISLEVIPALPLGKVKADPGQMEQAIMNLAVNARDAMPEGGKLTLETANVELDEEYTHKHIAVKPGRYVMLSVSDTGKGMMPEVRERIFEPFFTTKERDKGTGLGLSTVYGIVKQSGGNIWVYSELGHGTTFKIYLPQVDEPLTELREEIIGETPRGSETVLVVEDEEVVRKLAVRILEKQGYKVLEAQDGGKAFMLCEEYKEPIHLILTDVVMPGMSGRKLVERLKEIHPEMKALYMSGYTDNAILHHGILESGINFLQKPFTVDSLAKKVREALDTPHPALFPEGRGRG